MLADFQNFFNARFTSKYATTLSLTIPTHLKHVAALPYRPLRARTHQIHFDETEKIEKNKVYVTIKNQPNDRLRQQNHHSINQSFLNAMENLFLHTRNRSLAQL